MSGSHGGTRRLVLGIAVVALLGVGVILLRDSGPAFDSSYYWDESEERLYVDEVGLPVPHEGIGGAGGDGWRAVVYSCGDCGDRATLEVAYFERMTEDLRRVREEADAARTEGRELPEAYYDRTWVTANTLIRAPGMSEWHARSSPDGVRITAVLSRKCENGAYPTVCVPGE